MRTDIDETAEHRSGDRPAEPRNGCSGAVPATVEAGVRRGHPPSSEGVVSALRRIGDGLARLLRARPGGRPDADASYAFVEHELKTPITSIRSAAEILFDHADLSAEERRHFLRAVLEDSRRLEQCTERLLRSLARQRPAH